MKSFVRLAAASFLALTLGAGAAYADGCSGRSHTNGTVLGAAGGALAGGLIGGDLAGAAVGGVAGGLLGNSVARSQDCNRGRNTTYRRADRDRSYYVDRHGRRHYYRR